MRTLAALLIICLAMVFHSGCTFDPFGTRKEVAEVKMTSEQRTTAVRKDVGALEIAVENLAMRLDEQDKRYSEEIAVLKSSIRKLRSSRSMDSAPRSRIR